MTRTYAAWRAMRNSCNDPSATGYEFYGGRGITVCARWGEFSEFLADMGERPSPKHSLDRIDVDGNYGPDNCRWATKDVQQHNRRAKSNTGERGISWIARYRHYAWAISRRGKRLGGTARTIDEAITARDAAEQELYGEAA